MTKKIGREYSLLHNCDMMYSQIVHKNMIALQMLQIYESECLFMFEVLLGYLSDISDFINYIIDYIRDIVFMAQGKEEVTDTPSDEEKLQSQSLYNN